jgi:hypothetical protein
VGATDLDRRNSVRGGGDRVVGVEAVVNVGSVRPVVVEAVVVVLVVDDVDPVVVVGTAVVVLVVDDVEPVVVVGDDVVVCGCVADVVVGLDDEDDDDDEDELVVEGELELEDEVVPPPGCVVVKVIALERLVELLEVVVGVVVVGLVGVVCNGIVVVGDGIGG